ncbi:MAG: Lrp/AsnC ligand binding domain-containing protein [Candidatus Thermoplasmatota archaeon]|nr:Lrp/AsnC ligand binding domain-containing protein [Candidatus Thermoplasmatota archaeon]MEC8106514.1 Lrp/AsnC ligand binding domain-containing protein [Candidatus Thermoplasmatota archaeon]MED5496620.1 Lrp/AsnC ligand binding domain-containing protein [Candidatus Thermoplasmatota archaeon]|tara:strand:+ start:152 stop:394 length:243 start_codon:yes stop_codon:yes gene_type:complete
MAAIALVLLTTEPGREQDVVKELSRMSEIEEAMVLFGEYDVYCKVVVEDFSQLSDLVLRNVRTLSGVVETTTLTAANHGQ